MSDVWTTGYSGYIKISTFLPKEREIDVDDREAQLTIRLELLETLPFALQAQDLDVTLKFDFTVPDKPDSITIGGRPKGPLQIIKASDGLTLAPGEVIERVLAVRTGVFSVSPPDRNTKPAIPGRKDIDVDLAYTLAPVNPAGTEKIERDLTLQFVIAKD
ncbi:hypothetical protein C7271_10925 [filamentous cyanobacterium CCP5]|nr:hypothetical protein C7271_10925 [filamentous cyanobacterium CCP5]